jgi:hypothetical protein
MAPLTGAGVFDDTGLGFGRIQRGSLWCLNRHGNVPM